jgi:hypothetical protein
MWKALSATAVLGGLFWLEFVNTVPLPEIARSVSDRFDKRPTQTVLFVGNSRTYYNEMPYMVRRIADSAHSNVKFQISVQALAGASFESLWDDQKTKSLLSQTWNNVIFQGESRAQSSEESKRSFNDFGEKLMLLARAHQSPPALIVNWAYGESLYKGYRAGTRDAQYNQIQDDHRKLALRAGARMINVGQAWERLLQTNPSFSLYEDGNHPTVFGSYLSALMVYRYLSGGQAIGDVTYAPDGISLEAATRIKRVVQSSF